jgi:benzoate membrane transport protein
VAVLAHARARHHRVVKAGPALTAARSGVTLPEAVGAFIVAALLRIATLFRPLTRLIAIIRASVASGMLAAS